MLLGDLSKGGLYWRSFSGGSFFIKRRDKLLKMWGWGVFVIVIEGFWVVFGFVIWRKECSVFFFNYIFL